jgi:hypothetical protein
MGLKTERNEIEDWDSHETNRVTAEGKVNED